MAASTNVDKLFEDDVFDEETEIVAEVEATPAEKQKKFKKLRESVPVELTPYKCAPEELVEGDNYSGKRWSQKRLTLTVKGKKKKYIVSYPGSVVLPQTARKDWQSLVGPEHIMYANELDENDESTDSVILLVRREGQVGPALIDEKYYARIFQMVPGIVERAIQNKGRLMADKKGLFCIRYKRQLSAEEKQHHQSADGKVPDIGLCTVKLPLAPLSVWEPLYKRYKAARKQQKEEADAEAEAMDVIVEEEEEEQQQPVAKKPQRATQEQQKELAGLWEGNAADYSAAESAKSREEAARRKLQEELEVEGASEEEEEEEPRPAQSKKPVSPAAAQETPPVEAKKTAASKKRIEVEEEGSEEEEDDDDYMEKEEGSEEEESEEEEDGLGNTPLPESEDEEEVQDELTQLRNNVTIPTMKEKFDELHKRPTREEVRPTRGNKPAASSSQTKSSSPAPKPKPASKKSAPETNGTKPEKKQPASNSKPASKPAAQSKNRRKAVSESDEENNDMVLAYESSESESEQEVVSTPVSQKKKSKKKRSRSEHAGESDSLGLDAGTGYTPAIKTHWTRMMQEAVRPLVRSFQEKNNGTLPIYPFADVKDPTSLLEPQTKRQKAQAEQLKFIATVLANVASPSNPLCPVPKKEKQPPKEEPVVTKKKKKSKTVFEQANSGY